MLTHDHISRSRGTRAAALLASGGVLAGSAVVGLLPTVANASSHREAPLIAADPAVDNTDVYAFTSPEDTDTVTLIGNWTPFEEPNGGPNFYPWAEGAAYDINIDNDGDAVADYVYRWVFSTQDARGTSTFLYNKDVVTSLGDPDLLFKQTYDLTVSTDGGATFPTTLLDDAPVAPSFTGPAGMPDYDALRNEAIRPFTTTGGAAKSMAAQADDSFFLDLRVFDLLYGKDLSETGQDTLAGYNVNTIALQVPKADVAINNSPTDNPVIGVWSTTSRPSITTRNTDGSVTNSGALQQVSRLGQPLVNEVIVPTGLKDAFNALRPDQDAGAAGGAVVARVLDPEVPQLIEGIYGIDAPATPRSDIFEVFLTGVTNQLDGQTYGGYTHTAPIAATYEAADPSFTGLNSQVENADGVDPADFVPSEMLRLNMSIAVSPSPSRLGVIGGDLQGFPNGRRLGDDVVDIELLALEGVYDAGNIPPAAAPLAGGDGVNQNGAGFTNSFPYVALPNQGAVNGGAHVGDGNPQPVPPATTDATGQPAANANANGYPTGGVETGEGGFEHVLLPALTGSAALLLLGAGAGSLIRGRTLRHKAIAPSGA